MSSARSTLKAASQFVPEGAHAFDRAPQEAIDPLSDANIEAFWSLSGVAGVVQKMDRSDVWAIDREGGPVEDREIEALLRSTLGRLSSVIQLERANTEDVLIEHQESVAHFLGHLRSSRALAAFKLLLERSPGAAISLMQRGMDPDQARNTFVANLYERVRVLERARLLSRVFDPERIAVLLEIMDDDRQSKTFLE